jgi:hypothetical protein
VDEQATWMPSGSDLVARWAASQRLAYAARPDESWFRAWEPHDTMIAPELWLNAVTKQLPGGLVVVAEAYAAGERCDPIERAIVAFGQLRGPTRRAAMRTGEPYLTKTVFLEQAPPPRVSVGDPVWDEHVSTFAASGSEAAAAFPTGLRKLLAKRGFRGHLEVRPGGFVVHHEGLGPRPEHYDLLFRVALDVGGALAAGR